MRDSYVLYEDKLQGEYKGTFQKISTYVLTQNVDEDTRETQMMELLDTFLLAQEEGRPVEKIVGNDLESFCKNFCSQFGWDNKILNLVDSWKNLAWLFVFIGGVGTVFIFMDIIFGEEVNLWDYESAFNITGYVIAIAIMMALDTIVNIITIKLIFKNKKDNRIMKIVRVIQVIETIVCFIIGFGILQSNVMNFLQLPSWILLVVGGIYLLIYYRFNKERIKERKASKVSLFGMLKEDIERDTDIEFQKQMQKTYEKKRDRLLRRGKPELSWSDFIDAQEKDVQKAYKFKPLYDWLPTIITLPLGFVCFMENGFGADLIKYVVILFVVETLLIKGMWKIEKGTLEVKTAWIKVEREKLEQTKKEETI